MEQTKFPLAEAEKNLAKILYGKPGHSYTNQDMPARTVAMAEVSCTRSYQDGPDSIDDGSTAGRCDELDITYQASTPKSFFKFISRII